MKTKIKATTAAMTALMGFSQIALADSGANFTPVEDLSPAQRQHVYAVITNASDLAAQIDWDKVVVGINDNGEITFMEKTEAGLQLMSAPSTFTEN
jgi:hypothetical protein